MEPKVKDPPVSRVRLWPYILGVIFLILMGTLVYFFRERKTRDIVTGFASDPAEYLENTNGRTNVVFLGLGGEGHESPDLTDSIIFISLRHTDNSVTMLSIPRDVWVNTLKARINTAYHYGNEKREGAGRDLAKSAVSEVVGQPVHYVLTLDFKGFVKAIDAVGGVDVTVDRTFDDYKYPVPGKETVEPESDRYEHLHFDAGSMHMDGETALKFARSRHAQGEEGTDFARSARQQKVILAFKDKLLQSQTFLNKDKLVGVFDSLSSSIDTNIVEKDYGSFFKFFLAFQKAGSPIKSVGIEKYFQNPKNKVLYGGAWVLVPIKDWQEVHDYVAKSLE